MWPSADDVAGFILTAASHTVLPPPRPSRIVKIPADLWSRHLARQAQPASSLVLNESDDPIDVADFAPLRYLDDMHNKLRAAGHAVNDIPHENIYDFSFSQDSDLLEGFTIGPPQTASTPKQGVSPLLHPIRVPSPRFLPLPDDSRDYSTFACSPRPEISLLSVSDETLARFGHGSAQAVADPTEISAVELPKPLIPVANVVKPLTSPHQPQSSCGTAQAPQAPAVAPSTPVRKSTASPEPQQYKAWFEDPKQFRARSDNHVRYDWTWSEWGSPSREIIVSHLLSVLDMDAKIAALQYEEYQSPEPMPLDLTPSVLRRMRKLFADHKAKHGVDNTDDKSISTAAFDAAMRIAPRAQAPATATCDAFSLSDGSATDSSSGRFSPVDIKAILSAHKATEPQVPASADSPVRPAAIPPPPKLDLGAIFAKTPDLPEDSEDISSGFSAVDVAAVLGQKKMIVPEPENSSAPGTPCPVRKSLQSHFTARRTMPENLERSCKFNFYESTFTPAPEPAAKSGFGWKTIAGVAIAAAAVGAGLAYAFFG